MVMAGAPGQQIDPKWPHSHGCQVQLSEDSARAVNQRASALLCVGEGLYSMEAGI